ncbi:MAG: hypothetical protein JO210_20345 [Acidobacteriaceae bacterium]|nr:hypothetical protein [Acidobacteriaceae bacterium]
MKSVLLGLMLTGAALIPGEMARAASIPVFSTGVVSPGVLQADGLPDLHYTLTSAPAGVSTGSVFVTDQGGFPFPFWAADDSNSKWVSPQPSYNNSQTDPPGTFVYTTTFSLDGLLPSTASLVFELGTDNETVDVLLNGVSTGITYVGFGSLSSPFTIDTGFTTGTNTLTFDTLNYAGTIGNPAGLRVSITGTAAATPEPASAALVIVAAGLFGVWIARRKIAA